ncbi:MAG: hypothetical protein M3R02_11355 [Chloroflexota bacterium]|nr:hypothetical protein [Chloroflexota bacterium]
MPKQIKSDKSEQKPQPLTNQDILESYGLVQIYDATVGAYRQVPREEAERMVAALEETKKALEGSR